MQQALEDGGAGGYLLESLPDMNGKSYVCTCI